MSCLGPIGADHFGPISKVGCFGPILRVNCFGPDEVHPDFALIRLTKSYIFDGVRLMNNLRYIHVYCFYKGEQRLTTTFKCLLRKKERWMDGWMNGWMDGWTDGWTHGQIDRQTDRDR